MAEQRGEGRGRLARGAGVLALAGVATVAVACSSSSANGPGTSSTSAPASAATALLAAARTSLDAGSARVSLDVSVSGSGIGAQQITGSGAFDYATHDATLTLDIPQLAQVLGGGTLHVVVANGTAYVQLPSSVPVDGGKWVSEPVSSLGGSSSVLGGSAPGDPSELLSALEAAGAQVTEVGTTQIQGTSVTEYAVQVDLAKLAAAAPSGVRESDVAQAEQELGSSTLPLKVWVDGAGRVRRVSMSLTVTPNASSTGSSGPTGPVSLDMVIDISDDGVPVQVTAPPASEVVPSSALSGASSS